MRLAALCENYWFPLDTFVRQAGVAADDARDLTQAFFAGLLANLAAVGRSDRPSHGESDAIFQQRPGE